MASPDGGPGGLPPAPTEEQMALSDATFQAVALGIDPNTGMLSSPTHDLTIINALTRSLKALPPQVPFPPPPNMVPPQRSLAITKAKEDGNAAFKKGELAEAIKMYTLAVDVAASRPLWESHQIACNELSAVLANRSAALAEVKDYISALCDAEAVIKLKRPWSKGHYRKGKALAGLGRHREAREAYEVGMQFDPDNPVSQICSSCYPC